MVAERDAGLRGADPVEVVRGPDLHDRQLPAVELIGRDRGGLVTVDHTVIESYSAQIAERKGAAGDVPLRGPETAELAHAPQYTTVRRTADQIADYVRCHRSRQQAFGRSVTSTRA